MNKNELFRILDDWNSWNKEQDTGILRPRYVDKMRQLSSSKQVLVVTGARRSGKSYLMRQFARDIVLRGTPKKLILFVNFEDPRFGILDTRLLDDILAVYREFLHVGEGEKQYIFLDEIQEVSGWEKWVRAMHEMDKAHFIISGSNARLLSRELSTLLTGRHQDMVVYPLSFREYLSFVGKDVGVSSETPDAAAPQLLGAFREYLSFGGFPGAVFESAKEQFLLTFFSDMVEKDLVKRYRVRKPEKMKSMLKFYMSNISTLTTWSSAAKFLDISSDTAEKFSSYFESAYLVFFLKRFSFKVREQEKSPRKVYGIDTGLARAVGFQVGENTGRMAKNAVFLELLRRKSDDPSLELFYWKNEYHHEVDFVIRRRDGTSALQVCWNIEHPETKEREIRSLLKGLDALGLAEGTVITEEKDDEEVVKGKTIRYIPLSRWMLENNRHE